MSIFGCDECGWHGDEPTRKSKDYFCPLCRTIVATELDAYDLGINELPETEPNDA